jgi:monofunctional biosynthetic peptidoglycan transglycosylase
MSSLNIRSLLFLAFISIGFHAMTNNNDQVNSTSTDQDNPGEPFLMKGANEDVRWRIINDGVMGGLSQSQFEMDDDGIFHFRGEVRLENNGGFASVRSFPHDFQLNSNISAFLIRVKGDGQKYQFRFRTNDRWDGVSYTQTFDTLRDQWMTVWLPVEKFRPQFRGNLVPQAPPLDPSLIEQAGILIADKQTGEFHLQVEWVRYIEELDPAASR